MALPALVTGATGEIGFQVVKQLRERGESVRVVVRRSSRHEALRALGAEIVFGDLTDRASLISACQGMSGVYHIGALYRETGLPVSAFHAVNVEGVRNIFEAAIQAGIPRLIHCSTGGVLGDIKNPPGSHLTPYNPGDPYQVSKVAGEKLALEYFRSGKISGCVIRPAMVYGPGDTRHLKLFRSIARRSFMFVGAGDKFVHFIDIRDLARSFLLAMSRTEINADVFHIAGEKQMTLKEAVTEIARQLNVPTPKLHIPAWPVQMIGSLCELVCAPFGIKPPIYRRRVDFFTKSRFFDTKHASEILGFKPAQSFPEEVRDTITYYQKEKLI